MKFKFLIPFALSVLWFHASKASLESSAIEQRDLHNKTVKQLRSFFFNAKEISQLSATKFELRTKLRCKPKNSPSWITSGIDLSVTYRQDPNEALAFYLVARPAPYSEKHSQTQSLLIGSFTMDELFWLTYSTDMDQIEGANVISVQTQLNLEALKNWETEAGMYYRTPIQINSVQIVKPIKNTYKFDVKLDTQGVDSDVSLDLECKSLSLLGRK